MMWSQYLVNILNARLNTLFGGDMQVVKFNGGTLSNELQDIRVQVKDLQKWLKKQKEADFSMDRAVSNAHQICSKQTKDLDNEVIHAALVELDRATTQTV